MNDGNGSFTDSGQALGVSKSGGVALGDLDGDGDLDAFVANSGANKVWLNDGSGHFADSLQALGDSNSLGVALGDVDGDGDLDAFVANGPVGGAPNLVWLNNGLGVFADSDQELGNSSSIGVALGDVDGDHDLDAFVANGGSANGSANKVWLNNVGGVPSLICAGFPPPFDQPLSLKAKSKRAIPADIVLTYADGVLVTDLNIITAPVINVTFAGDGTVWGQNPPDDADLLPVGAASDDNLFSFFSGTGEWRYVLGTKQFTAPGLYTVGVASGDGTEYTIATPNAACAQTFSRLP